MTTPAFSVLEALISLTTSVPEWNARLDDLNGQIALRQIELARLTESPRSVRSIKNKGSTESLRPNDGSEGPGYAQDEELKISASASASPITHQNGFVRPESPSVARAAAAARLEPDSNSNPVPSPNALNRKSSQPTPPTQTRLPTKLRKRKTESLASGGSREPKYRTRSMIIVYYDSAVQTAFEDLVKFVSANRNAMRKGKMAAKMEEMKRAAELEMDGSDDEEDDGDYLDGGLPSLRVGRAGEKGGEYGDGGMPKLRFISTRNMGPLRDHSAGRDVGNTLSLAMMKGYRRAGGGEAPDIFDELDKGLEWCQGQCEHAAHQFLRDGECTTEIENIKRKLVEIKEQAEKHIEKLKREEAMKPRTPARTPRQGTPEPDRIVKKEPSNGGLKVLDVSKDLEVDDNMEVDSEEEDIDPPKLFFKRSRDVAF